MLNMYMRTFVLTDEVHHILIGHHILEQVGTARGALGRAWCTTPQFGPLGGPVSRPERANFEATVRGRKCDFRKDHYSPG